MGENWRLKTLFILPPLGAGLGVSDVLLRRENSFVGTQITEGSSLIDAAGGLTPEGLDILLVLEGMGGLVGGGVAGLVAIIVFSILGAAFKPQHTSA